MKIRLFILTLLMFFQLYSFAQKPSDSMRISLAGIQVSNLDSSIQWYTHYIGFELIEKKEFPDAKLKLAFLKKGDVELEFVEKESALNRLVVLQEKKMQDITGIGKLTFTVHDIRSIYDQLLAKKIKFLIPLKKSNRKSDEMFFVVIDNEHNLLQFIGKEH